MEYPPIKYKTLQVSTQNLLNPLLRRTFLEINLKL